MVLMKKAALYSSSPAQRSPGVDVAAGEVLPTPPPAAVSRRSRSGWVLGLVAGLVLALGLKVMDGATGHRSAPLNMRLIEATLRKSLQEKPLTPLSVTAGKLIAPSVVRVMGVGANEDARDELLTSQGLDLGLDVAGNPKKFQRGVGSGVVIIDNGTILTNLHVLQGALRITVTFANGHTSDAVLVHADPKNDLAVLRALSVPDDLQAAAMGSTADLAPGEPVVAVGFPFGIGPSTSSGVVSGLKREFRSSDGAQVITNLIQFDAAANPGNSGGPLITLDGSVVGIVTGILNPTEQHVFIGIGFAVPIENAASAAGMPPF
jgi:S1-C subfamily serine protease